MKVKDLVKRLSELDQEKEIMLEDTEGPFPITKVYGPEWSGRYYLISSYE